MERRDKFLLIPIFIVTFLTVMALFVSCDDRKLEAKAVLESKTVRTAIIKESEYPLTEEEIEFIALITYAEAEGEPVEGQRLVIDTILNRVDSEHFPDTVNEVILQENQFECVWNGRVDRSLITEDIVKLVKEELISRTNKDVVFFMAGSFSEYGTPIVAIHNHYFSGF